MIQGIVLDSGPLGLLVHQKVSPIVIECRKWVKAHTEKGITVFVPAIIDYELRRELLRLNKAGALLDLERFIALKPDRFLPLTTQILHSAAALWAQARQSGKPTSHEHDLDVDVILAAQSLSLGLSSTDFVVATTNVGHISRFVPAELWQNI